MHITALVDAVDHVCCRYRIQAYRPYFERAGHQLALCPWPRSYWSRLRLERLIGETDAVIVQRRLLTSWQLYQLHRASRLLIFDFDDAVYQRDSYARKGPINSRRHARFAATVKTADAVVAGNDFLAAEARRWTGAERIHVIPSLVDPDRYLVAEHERSGKGVQLAWIGCSSTLKGLELSRNLFETIGEQCPGLSMKIICDRFPQLRRLSIIECPWTEEDEARELATSDIGVSWLPDDGWSRGKCGLKVLQYMAAGLPVVANPVGVQADMVKHGQTGLHASTADEWCSAIRTLMNDPVLRRRMGEAGRRRVEREYSVELGAARWLQLLDSLFTFRARKLESKTVACERET